MIWKSLDYKFKTDTGTETLALGRKKGIKFIYELDGMFILYNVNKNISKISMQKHYTMVS